jgi:hypothetical protein
MGLSEEELRRVAELKQWLEEQIEAKEAELAKLKENLDAVNSILKKASFITASELSPVEVGEEAKVEPQEVTAAVKFTQTIPLRRTKDGKLLANVYASEDEVVIVPVSDLNLKSSIHPFKSFFVTRILDGMRNKDLELVSQGRLSKNQVISYEIEEDEDGSIKRIIIRNFREKRRLNEIVSACKWVFTTMLGKIEG